jgi:hypothetical protein
MDQAAKNLLAKVSGGNKKQKGLPKRTGKRKSKYAFYYQFRYPAHKLRKIFRRNGVKAARAWAEAHVALMLFEKMKAQRGV